MIAFALQGASGKMGQAILRLAAQEKDFQVVCALIRPSTPTKQLWNVEQIPYEAQLKHHPSLLLDFSTPEATLAILPFCIEKNIKLVIGTTGFNREQEQFLKKASGQIPLLYSSNMSFGIQILKKLIHLTTQILSEEYDIEITEAHHRLKKDAPSGTAKLLAQTVLDATQRNESQLKYGRCGLAPRSLQEIGIHSLRLGGVVGEHTVSFANETEQIDLTHRAFSRDVFAKGALLAARFLDSQSAGFYTMEDLLKF